MKFLIFFIPIFIYAKTYVGIIKPIHEYTLYSQVSGKIVQLDKNDETKLLNKDIIKIDSRLKSETLKLYKKQLRLKEESLQINEANYKKFIKIKGKSKVDKDEKLLEIIDLKSSIVDLKVNIEELEDNIKHRTISVHNLYVKEFDVNKYDYVTAGTKLVTVYDISKAKVVIYVNSVDYKNILKKKIYLNGKLSNLKINKLDITNDSTYLSSYKVEIQLDSKAFGKTIKVEFK